MIAKKPAAGQVKTRLVPPLSVHQAADIAAAALSDTLDTIDRLDTAQKVLSCNADPGILLRPGWRSHRQPDGGLDVRITSAFVHVASAGPAVLIGMDTPQIDAGMLAQFDHGSYDACLGLTRDGGYWVLGLRDPVRAVEVVPGVAMSTGYTGAEQLRRLHIAGMRVQLLETLIDVDTIDDATEVAAQIPSSKFASAVRRIGLAAA